jgi:uncharacterized protein (TIGR02145 family)
MECCKFVLGIFLTASLAGCNFQQLARKTGNKGVQKAGEMPGGRNTQAIPQATSPEDSVPVYEPDSSGLTDYDGNRYRIISIGRQTWMAENLKVTKYNDGTPVELVNDTNEWGKLVTGAYCWFGNDSSQYASPMGALYNWYTVETKKLCPAGWHVPANYEWEILANKLGGTDNAGGKLKDNDTSYWDSPNTGATNESGFTALPGGGRGVDGVFGNYGLNSIFWSSTVFDENFAMNRSISHYLPGIFSYGSHKRNGFSVRCLRDR